MVDSSLTQRRGYGSIVKSDPRLSTTAGVWVSFACEMSRREYHGVLIKMKTKESNRVGQKA